jgi:hypothetical protein
METAMVFITITMYFILSNLFQFKHFVADYLLQNEYMLGKFKETDWVKPLAAHCGVHALFTFFILLVLCPWLSFTIILFLTILDFVIHFVMDRIKASPKMLGKFQSLTKADFEGHGDVVKHWTEKGEEYEGWVTDLSKKWEQRKKSNKFFWISLGVDQLVHHLTHELIVYIAVLMFIL